MVMMQLMPDGSVMTGDSKEMSVVPIEQVTRRILLIRGKKVIIWRAEPVDGPDTGSAPGTVVAVRSGCPVVQTAEGLLALADVKIVDAPAATLAAGQVLG